MDQLEWESRYGRVAAGAAFAAAALAVAGVILYSSAIGTYNDSTELLVAIHKHPFGVMASAVLQSLSVAMLVPVLLYLLAATAYRRPETPAQVRPIVLFAPALAAVLNIAQAAFQLRAAHNFFPELPLPPKVANDRAHDFISQSPAPLVSYLLLAVNFLVAGAIGIVSLNAMRAGLLNRFMGILGIILAVLTAIPFFFGGPSIIQFFWLLAVGVLFLDRWPGGRGPAWDSGEPIPWPSAAEVRQRAMEERRGEAEPEPEPAQTAVATAEHPRSKKRKRKRRR
jgi:hypothetical protein